MTFLMMLFHALVVVEVPPLSRCQSAGNMQATLPLTDDDVRNKLRQSFLDAFRIAGVGATGRPAAQLRRDNCSVVFL